MTPEDIVTELRKLQQDINAITNTPEKHTLPTREQLLHINKYLAEDRDHWMNKAKTLETAIQHAEETLNRTNLPPEPPIGTRYYHTPNLVTETSTPEWIRTEEGWTHPNELNFNTQTWKQVYPHLKNNYELTRYLPGETP